MSQAGYELFISLFDLYYVLLRLCPSILGWARYAVSAAAVLGYCRIRYKGCAAAEGNIIKII